MKINLGCGTDIKEGYINIDKIQHKGVNIIHDLDIYPYPFKDKSVDEIIAFHILEHVKDYEKTIEELKRILKKGGILHIKVPHFSAPCANSEFHKRFFWWNSFTSERLSGSTTSLESHQYDVFKTIVKRLNFEKKPFFWNYLVESLLNMSVMPQVYEHTVLHNLFPCFEIEIKLQKSCLKNGANI